MNFYNIRIVIFILILIILYILIRKKIIKAEGKKGKIIIPVSLILIFLGLFNYEIEAKFLEFETLEKAINYSYGKKEIVSIIDSKNCMFVKYKEDDDEIICTDFIKDNGKVKFKSAIHRANGRIIKSGDIYIIVQKTKMGDTYIEVENMFDDGKERIEISDSLNSEFHRVIEPYYSEYRSKYYTVLDELPYNYYVVIDNERINII